MLDFFCDVVWGLSLHSVVIKNLYLFDFRHQTASDCFTEDKYSRLTVSLDGFKSISNQPKYLKLQSIKNAAAPNEKFLLKSCIVVQTFRQARKINILDSDSLAS